MVAAQKIRLGIFRMVADFRGDFGRARTVWVQGVGRVANMPL